MNGLIRWEDLSAPEFREISEPKLAILPLGATEQHGPHLAVSVDSDLADAVISRLSQHSMEGLTALVLPTLRITKSDEHHAHAGTLSLSGETLLAVLRDIANSVRRAGIERLFLLNAHGGNTAILEVAVRAMRREQNLIAAHASWFAFAETEGLFDPAKLAVDIHAGDTETSAMLAAEPHKVDMQLAQNFRSAMLDWQDGQPWIGLSGQAVRPGWVIDDLNADGACGDASAATAEKGEALLNTAAQNLAAFLRDFVRFDHRKTGPESA